MPMNPQIFTLDLRLPLHECTNWHLTCSQPAGSGSSIAWARLKTQYCSFIRHEPWRQESNLLHSLAKSKSNVAASIEVGRTNQETFSARNHNSPCARIKSCTISLSHYFHTWVTIILSTATTAEWNSCRTRNWAPQVRLLNISQVLRFTPKLTT